MEGCSKFPYSRVTLLAGAGTSIALVHAQGRTEQICGAQSSINCYDLRFQHVSSYFFLIGPVHSPTQYVHWASRSDPACCCDSAPAVGKPCRWRPVPFASRFFCFWHKARMMMFLWMGLFRPAICCRPKSHLQSNKITKEKETQRTNEPNFSVDFPFFEPNVTPNVTLGICLPNVTSQEAAQPIADVVAHYGGDGYCTFGFAGYWASGCAITRREQSALYYATQFNAYYTAVLTPTWATPFTLQLFDGRTVAIRNRNYPLDTGCDFCRIGSVGLLLGKTSLMRFDLPIP